MAAAAGRRRVEPVPARFIRLRPSIFADAFQANRRYLLDLDPQRLLHNFYVSAGLPAPKPTYGGWEAMGIAGHSLGHWLSACSLSLAGGDDPELAARLDLALAEMARIQSAHGDGYCGGTTVERDGRTVDGKIVFEEIRRGEIRTGGFDLNGGWVPLYTWHKVHAGLIDAHLLARNPRAMPILLGLAGYLADVLEPLSEEQMQRVLHAEHGGLNESYADTYALTGNARWLRLAEKIRHRAVLDPLAARQDRLAGLHANTQIPKVIGLARLYEVTGKADHAAAARFFHERVTRHHSYVIGGNSEREHFGEPDQLSKRLTEATCEACNSYNMMKLTRHLYSWQPHASWFDYYERVQLNHIMAHQRPDTGRFVYFTPLAAGARRVFSSAEDSFWCCVGSGIESHAKHADSIWWSDPSTIYVNLFIPCELDWPERGLRVTMDGAMPIEGRATLTIGRAPRMAQAIAIRVPRWTKGLKLTVNGAEAAPLLRDGYAVVERRWRAGDVLAIDMPMALAAETMPDDPSVVAFLHGPLVLAADLGAADVPYDGVPPALVVDGTASGALTPMAGKAAYEAVDALGNALTLRPFYAEYDRRVAVYFPTFTSARWSGAKAGFVAAQAAARELARRTVDIVYLGEMQPERDHGFASARSEVVNWSGRSARRLKPGDSMQLTLARRAGPAVLRVLVAADAVRRPLAISVDGKPLANGRPVDLGDGNFAAIDFLVPQGGAAANVVVTAVKDDAVLYEIRLMTAGDGNAQPSV
ncbi:glycoside hydrolase family 127 protein [Sphingobium bisphenolivorans]|uniref:glycoside hydrolase family 127 protein n=1 Tax=Sphingobium bisphenolivorans TaxID=1335760 RepID=UPI0003A9C3BE|nr:glycoside hydrolase family 127 protein [Sphingobium bisphenolivorans]